MYTNEQLISIYNSKIGFEFEFFSKLKIKETKLSLTKDLNKRIQIEEKAHSDFTPTDSIFKLEPDNSGGTGMIELVTGPLMYSESKIILAKVFNWIKKNGSTNERCSIHINIAFNTEVLGPVVNISNLDTIKFILNFDEDIIYKEFPNRKDSVYAKSIKYIIPLGGMIYSSPKFKYLWRNYKSIDSKYYGVNFTKAPKGYLEFRYLGGKDYEQKYNSILKMINHFVVSLYESLNNKSYTKEDNKKLDKILDKHKKNLLSYKSYKKFKENFPNIKLTVDLSKHESIINTYYSKIREEIFKIITEGNMTKGLINYDSDMGKMQIKDTKLMNVFSINRLDIVDSTIQGNISNCDIFNCKIKNSSISNSNIFGDSELSKCKILSSYVNKNVNLNDCYVYGSMSVFSGNMKDGIFRQGRATKHASFNKTEIIEIEKI